MITGAPLLLVFGLSILFVLLAIIRFNLNPFLALLLTTILDSSIFGFEPAE